MRMSRLWRTTCAGCLGTRLVVECAEGTWQFAIRKVRGATCLWCCSLTTCWHAALGIRIHLCRALCWGSGNSSSRDSPRWSVNLPTFATRESAEWIQHVKVSSAWRLHFVTWSSSTWALVRIPSFNRIRIGHSDLGGSIRNRPAPKPPQYADQPKYSQAEYASRKPSKNQCSHRGCITERFVRCIGH